MPGSISPQMVRSEYFYSSDWRCEPLHYTLTLFPGASSGDPADLSSLFGPGRRRWLIFLLCMWPRVSTLYTLSTVVTVCYTFYDTDTRLQQGTELTGSVTIHLRRLETALLLIMTVLWKLLVTTLLTSGLETEIPGRRISILTQSWLLWTIVMVWC